MNIKKWVVALVCVVGLSRVSLAKIYEIPQPLLQEVATCEQDVKNRPNEAESHFELAMSYAYTGQIEKGWAQLKSIPNYDKDYASKVIKKYEAKVAENPKDWKSHFKLAFGYYFAQEKDKSIDSFKRVLDIDPKQIWAMGFIGLVEGERGNTDKGMEWSKKALAIEPNATAIHFLLAEGFRRKGDYLHALGHMMIVGRLKSEEALKR